MRRRSVATQLAPLASPAATTGLMARVLVDIRVRRARRRGQHHNAIGASFGRARPSADRADTAPTMTTARRLVGATGRRRSYPPTVATPHNLAMQLTSFVGREAEIAELCGVLRASRLV